MRLYSHFVNYFLHLNKNIMFLAIAQIFSMSAMNINMITSGLAGFLIAPHGWMSTLPLSILFIITMLGTVPFSLLMAKYGRKSIFIIGSSSTVLSGLMMALSLIFNQFWLLCLGSSFLGIGHSISQFYRYAATETVPVKVRPKAMSLVLSAGLVAAFLGPEIFRSTAQFLDNYLYAMTFLTMSIIQFLALPFILLLKIPLPKQTKSEGGRSLYTIFKQPKMIKAIISAAGGYSFMSFLMTATPLQIVNVCKFGISANANIIQWHVIAMFLPSFFTGSLIQRFTVEKVLFLGLIFYIIVLYTSITAVSEFQYLLVLFYLGLGWNFLFVGGSSLIVSSTRPEERGKVQGIADFIIFSCVAISSLSAGLMHNLIGWDKMVLASIPLVIFILLANCLKSR